LALVNSVGRPLVARLLGTREASAVVPLLLPALVAGGWTHRAHDFPPALRIAWLGGAIFFLTVYVLSFREAVFWDERGVKVRGLLRTETVQWADVSQVELGMIATGRGGWPGLVLHRRDRSVMSLRAFVFLSRRRRVEAARPLIAEAMRHGASVSLGLRRQWRPLDQEFHYLPPSIRKV
jgi:hypothetical protein